MLEGIISRISHQITLWDIAAGIDGGIGVSSTNIIVVPGGSGIAPTIRKPDTWWMDRATYGPLQPELHNQLPGREEFDFIDIH
jgi:hypothetical protein